MIVIQQERVDSLFNSIVDGSNHDLKSDGNGLLQAKISDSRISTCLVTLLSLLDPKINPISIYESLPYTKRDHLDYLDMLNAMMNLGYEFNQLDLDVSQIDERLLPCVFTLNNSTMLIILGFEGSTKDQVQIYDCEKKTTQLVKVDKIPKGNAAFFKKIDRKSSANQNNESSDQFFNIGSFSKLISIFAKQFSSIIFTSFLLNIFTLSMPIFVMVVYDKVIGTGQEKTLYYLVVGIMIALIAEVMFRIMRATSICWMGSRIDNIASNSIYKKILYMETSFTENSSISSQVAKIKSFESIRNFFTGPLFTTVIEMPFIIIMLTAIAMIEGSLVIVPIMAIAINIAIIAIFNGKIKRNNNEAAKKEAIKQEALLETFSKVHFFRYNGMSDAWLNKVRDMSAESAMANFKAGSTFSLLETITGAITSITVIATVVVGTNLIWEDKITVGALVATMIIIWRALAPLQAFSSILPKIQQTKASISQLDRLMKATSESDVSLSAKNLNYIEGHVELINIGIRYNQNTLPVFAGLNIEAKPGELIAINGDNGSGKTTILKLINKLYSPQIGSIRIDGIDIRQINPLDLRHYVDYLPQTPSFFEGSIADNLRLASPMATDTELEEALREVDALDDVKHLENGLYTKIGDNNPITTSLGYQLNLARSLLKESNILLLDELPFAVLNSKSGLAYVNLIKSLKGKKTIFFVTHREDHMQLADKVIILKKEQNPIIITNAKNNDESIANEQ